MKLNNKNVLFAIGLVVIASLSRLFPILPNFQPLLAIAVFSGIIFSSNSKISYLVPFGAILISDIMLHFFSELTLGYYAGFHSSMFSVYLSLALIVFFSKSINKEIKYLNILGTSLLSAILFFLITNFSYWLFGLDIMNMPYSKDFSGLFRCYSEAVPFFRYTVGSVLLYSFILFGVYLPINKTILSKA